MINLIKLHKKYYLFGTDAVRSYWEGERIGDFYAVFCYDENEKHDPTELLDMAIGWDDYCEIKESVYMELKKRKEVTNG